MRRTVPLAAVSALLVLAGCQDSSQPVAPPDPTAALSAQPSFSMAQQAERVMAGRVLARLQDGASPQAVGAAHGLALERVTAGYVMYQGATGNERATAAQMRGDTRVVWAEPDYIRMPSTIDPRLWAFYNPGGLTITFTRGGNKGQVVSSKISLDDADEDNVEGYASGGSAVTLASIDTGVDFTHPELTGLVMPGYDYYDNDNDPTDTQGHGTHTTGTMVGRNVGVAGVAGATGNVKVWVYRVCGQIGCPTSAIVSAIYAAADKGVVAMNMSLGGSSESQAEKDAIQYATNAGALVIASAGNDGTGTVSCPACDDNAISVAASNWQDVLSYYSNWGPGLDITAPGGEMYSNTSEESGIYSSVPGGYAYYQGTSMAAPQVTGTAGIVASKDGLSGAALRTRILGTTDDLGANGYDQTFGNGRLNSYRAVTTTTLNEGGSPPPPPPPSSLTASFTYACNGLDCAFDASGSTLATSWNWTFGGDGTGQGETVNHTFSGAGSYDVQLIVGDGNGGTDSTTHTVQCTLRGRKVRCG